jgi:hypothetical protein
MRTREQEQPASLLGYAGPTPTIGATTTVYFFLGKYGIGAPFNLVVTGPGVTESLFVRATPLTVLPPGGLVAYNPWHGGQRPNAADHGDYPADCVFGAPGTASSDRYPPPAPARRSTPLSESPPPRSSSAWCSSSPSTAAIQRLPDTASATSPTAFGWGRSESEARPRPPGDG